MENSTSSLKEPKKILNIKATPLLTVSFYMEYQNKILNDYKFENKIEEIYAFYDINSPNPFLRFEDYSFDLKRFNQKSGKLFYMKGLIAHYSTKESFNNLSNHDKLQEYLKNMNDSLPAFILFIFGNLKNYTFSYSLHEINNELDAQIKKLISFEKLEDNQKILLREISRKDNIIKHDESDNEILKYYSSPIYTLQDNQQYIFLYDISSPPTNIPNFFKIILKEKILLNQIKITESDQIINIILIKNISNLSNSVVLSVKISHKSETSFCALILNKSDLKIYNSDLKQMFDPLSIAENAVDLNINLMKWRMAPDINVEIIKQKNFLLVGSGTLGCHVARNLLGWGARNINFLDCSKVSYSNPVRQSLYTFKDSSENNNFKSVIAAQKLKEIFPMVNSEGYNLQIPLPSRSLVNSEAEENYLNTVKNLENIISAHDVIFLLTDSRESRWYPTLIARSMNKNVITSAIGFDSFLVMRHGNNQNDLGCYFCNDIVSPIDTSSNRTLDQQCTISRPGISSICSGFASEMAISMLQQGNSLGQNIPKSIRGNLTDYNFVCIDHARFKNCVACSDYVLNEYKINRDKFLKKIMNDPYYLENICEVDKLINEINLDEIELGDDF